MASNASRTWHAPRAMHGGACIIENSRRQRDGDAEAPPPVASPSLAPGTTRGS
jgi:hypothetical protein